VIDVADVVRRFAPAYLDGHGASMLASHRRALADIAACRTAELGGHLWRCTACSAEVYSYHGCRNRSCPKCHTDQTRRWLEARRTEMLPTHHFHVTVTVPAELRAVMRRHQRDAYGLLMGATAAAIIALARDPRYVGGTVGILAVLHTWTQRLDYHPHVHCLVSGGGVSADGSHWHPTVRARFLVPVKALAKLVRGKMRAAIAKRLPGVVVPAEAWRKPWVVHCVPWGEGEQAVLDYLARYVFRTAITNRRITAIDDDTVTFQYKKRDGAAGQWRPCTVSGHEFLRRFCQHILPKGFHKVRYYGLWHPSKRALAGRVRQMLLLESKEPLPAEPIGSVVVASLEAKPPRACPHCGKPGLVLVCRLTPTRYLPPIRPRPAMTP
jgi:predicted RNA-binding Zn-ribbon protein involved in translation (DUF1610 family)